MQTLDSSSIFGLQEVVERVQDVLDDLWRNTSPNVYPENRMKRLLDIASITFVGTIEKLLSQFKLWQDEFHKVCCFLQIWAKCLRTITPL